MIPSLKLLMRIGVVIVIVGATYVTPQVFSAEQRNDQPSQTNNKTMRNTNFKDLDIVTINFLNAIDEATSHYDSSNFSITEEMTVRVKLRDAFDEYFATLIPLETQEGLQTTERSRDVIQDAIAEFIESDSQYASMSEVALDLDAYSKVLTESLIHTAVNV